MNILKTVKNKKTQLLITAILCVLFIPMSVLAVDYWADLKTTLSDFIVKPAAVIAILCVIDIVWANNKNDPHMREIGVKGLGSAIFVASITSAAIWKWL